MDSGNSLHIWRRWWILSTVLLLLALAGAAATLMRLRTYQANSSVVLLASRSAAKPNGANPYLSFSPSLTLTADAVSLEVMAPRTTQALAARGFRDPYAVALAPSTTNTTGSVLTVTVSGREKAGVERMLHAVTGQIGVDLLQSQNGVRPRNQIRAVTLSYTPQPTLSVTQTARPVAAVAALGLLLGFGIPVVLDGMVARRRIRRHRVIPKRAPADAGAAGRLAYDRPQGNTREATAASYPR
jgi:hypothetical protein